MALILSVGVLVLFIDQLSKHYIQKLISFQQPVPVIDNLFHLTLIHNPGGAFGLFRRVGPLLFIIVSILTLTAIFIFWKKLPQKDLGWGISLGLIIGGALGNLLDRLRFGYVIDFLDFSLGGYHWPAFNFADLGISIGVVLLSYKMLKKR